MPFDPIAARKIIATLEAHRMHPGGELMETAAALLKEATDDAVGMMGKVRGAEGAAVEAIRKYEEELLETKRLREALVTASAAVETLKVVAAAKKGAAKLAEAWLVENGFVPKAEEAKA